MMGRRYLVVFLFCWMIAAVFSVEENEGEGETRPVSDFIEEEPASVLGPSLSKDWALRFDEEAGRGDYLTKEKELEIHNNLLEVAELLHIIPEGSASHYSKLILRATTEDPLQTPVHLNLVEEGLYLTIPDLRRHGITTFMNSPNLKNISTIPDDLSQEASNFDQNPEPEELLPLRKYSPRLSMYSHKKGDNPTSSEFTMATKGLRAVH